MSCIKSDGAPARLDFPQDACVELDRAQDLVGRELIWGRPLAFGLFIDLWDVGEDLGEPRPGLGRLPVVLLPGG